MESVATIEKFRGKGLIGELIHFIQSEVMNRGLDNLWVIPIRGSAEIRVKLGHSNTFFTKRCLSGIFVT